jgi:hypothetical protein
MCRQAKAEHDASCRQFAHVFHKKNIICVAPEFYDLPQSYRMGILLHEIGHLECDIDYIGHTEQEADDMAYILSDVRIARRTYRGAHRLECVKRSDYGKALDFLRKHITV